MSGPIKKSHEVIVQILYSFEMNAEEEEVIPTLMHELKLSKKTVQAAYKKALLIWETKQKWDKIITTRSDSYTFKRIGHIEKSILRMALYELACGEDSKEIISESLRIAKKFCGGSAATFIHALLDREDS